MSTIRESVEVAVPVREAYNQWTQFEEFPRFMRGVKNVQQLTSDSTRWVTQIGGVTREFEAKITRQEPDVCVAWESLDSPRHAGTVTFDEVDSRRTMVHLTMEFEPEGLLEKAGERLGVVEARIEADLEAFKDFIEKRGSAEDGWRGHIGSTGTPASGDELRPGVGSSDEPTHRAASGDEFTQSTGSSDELAAERAAAARTIADPTPAGPVLSDPGPEEDNSERSGSPGPDETWIPAVPPAGAQWPAPAAPARVSDEDKPRPTS